MKTWITSDQHLGEDRFDLMQRPFSSVDEHNNTIVTNHNSKIASDDLVYFVGDVIYQKADPSMLELISNMNGRKVLIRGNHDRPFSDEQFASYFEKIIPEGQGVELQIGDLSCWATHYPTLGKTDKFNLCAHIHGAWKFQLNMLNVGVDVHHFCPVDLDRIPFFFKAISEFYDNDVWVAYQPMNSDYQDSRGKKSNYFVEAK